MRRLWLAGAALFICSGAASATIAITASPQASPPASASAAISEPPADRASLPPAAVAGLVGLLALGLAFRPRKPANRAGLPEVTS